MNHIAHLLTDIVGFVDGEKSKNLKEYPRSTLEEISKRLAQALEKAADIQAHADALTQGTLELGNIQERVLNNIPTMIGYWNKDLINAYANKAYSRYFGKDSLKMRGLHIKDLLGESIYQLNLPFIQGVLAGTPQSFERDLPSPDGKGKRRTIAQYIPDSINGDMKGFYVIVTEITELADYRDQLEVANRLLKTISDHIPGCISRCDLDGKHTFANATYKQWLGLDTNQIIGRTKKEILPSATFLQVESHIKRASKGERLSFEAEVKIITGEVLSVLVTQVPDIDSNGNHTGYFNIVLDVTELKRKRLESETTLKTMAEGVVIQNKLGEIEQFNEAALQLLGLSEDQLKGRTSLDPRWKAVHEDGSEYSGDQHPAMVALRTNMPVRNQLMGLTLPSGQERWIKINAVPFEVATERKVVCTFGDMTEIIRANRDMYHIFNHSMDLICIAGMDGKFKKVSPSFHKTLGWSEDELLSDPFLKFIHPDDVAKTTKEVEKLASGLQTINFENRYHTKSGQYRIFNWVCEPDLKTGLIYATGRDVTDLRESEIKNQQILDAVSGAAIVAITDINGVLTDVNDNFCTISGYKRDELIGKTHHIINSGAHTKEFIKNLWTTIKSGKTWSGEIENRSKSGEHYFVKSLIAPFKSLNGTIEQFIAIRFDV